MNIIIRNTNCYLTTDFYSNGTICLSAVTQGNHVPYMRITVSIPEVKVPQNHIVVKNYSKNEGILKELWLQGVIEEEVDIHTRHFPSHSVQFYLCKLTEQAVKELGLGKETEKASPPGI